jgi:glutathione S-transferase
MLTLYYSPGACSLVSHIALEEAGAEYRGVALNLANGDQHQPEFLKVNPHARVPALVTDEGTITENIAILNYLGQRFGAEGSVPQGDAYSTARCNQLLSWLGGTVHAGGFAQLFRPARFSPDEALHEGIRDGGRAALASHFAELDDLCGDDWLTGGQFTAADSYAAVFFRWALRAKFDMSVYKRWAGLTRRVIERPAVARAFEQEGLGADEFA